MAEVKPLRALRYDVGRVGPLGDLVAPPYDVLGEAERAALAARSPYNVVHVDLPEAPDGGDRYAHAGELLARWQADGAMVRDDGPALWALTQDYTGPDGRRRTRRGFLARVRVEPYGPGRVRPHERTHPGPREDRLRLTRATKANVSPIFALHADPPGAAWGALQPHVETGPPHGEATDADGTVHRLWRVGEPAALERVREALAPAELLIADGHHRYETARAYADEVGGEGPHRYVLTCLVALEDPGLTVFPTHRLARVPTSEQQEALAQVLRAHFEIERVGWEALVPEPEDGDGPVRMGYVDAHFRQPFRLTLKDPDAVARALPDRPEPYRRLDTAVLEALILKGPLGMSDASIDHLEGLAYARDAAEARALIEQGTWDVAFFMGATPVRRVQEVAAAGVPMPPKSTFFYPKVPTGLVLNPLA
jgi:uncharacterized protein (DUF1015 family)